MNKNDNCIEGFHCVEFFRKVKDEISAELNAMTTEEELAYYKRSYQAALQEYEMEKAK